MNVQQADVIDFIVQDPKTNAIMLILIEPRHWDRHPKAVDQLENKL